ncbi:MAG: hypothetical protein RhofKO_38540 [Rhodothermales bacterium]
MTTRRVHSPEFKREAVRLAKERGNRSAVARDLGIHASLIRRWAQELEADSQQAFPGQGNPKDEELAQLRRELSRVREENAILKKAVGIFTTAHDEIPVH